MSLQRCHQSMAPFSPIPGSGWSAGVSGGAWPLGPRGLQGPQGVAGTLRGAWPLPSPGGPLTEPLLQRPKPRGRFLLPQNCEEFYFILRNRPTVVWEIIASFSGGDHKSLSPCARPASGSEQRGALRAPSFAPWSVGLRLPPAEAAAACFPGGTERLPPRVHGRWGGRRRESESLGSPLLGPPSLGLQGAR